MSQTTIDKLFVNFSKLDNSPENVHGTGLGLSICKKLLQKMGGVVKVKSKVGKGTTYKIEMQALCKTVTTEE